MPACDEVLAALAEFNLCVETPDGSRVTTHCVYPSFDPVQIFVTRFGDGFQVHDGAGAHRACWDHGKQDRLVKKAIHRWASRYKLSVGTDSAMICTVNSADWLSSAIIAVANASAGAANEVIEHIAVAIEANLKDRIVQVLELSRPQQIAKDYEHRGRSGKIHTFDFFVRTHDKYAVVMDAVSPHHVSISAKYVAFADLPNEIGLEKFAVHDRELERDDSALLQQVVSLIPINGLRESLSVASGLH